MLFSSRFHTLGCVLLNVFRKKNTQDFNKSFEPWFFDNINASRLMITYSRTRMICRVYSIYSNSEITSMAHAFRGTSANLSSNVYARQYIALYNLCSHGFYWSVRLIKRNKNLCAMAQKVDLQTKKWQRQKELIKRFFWDILLCKAFS